MLLLYGIKFSKLKCFIDIVAKFSTIIVTNIVSIGNSILINFIVMFGINTMSDILKLLYVISRAVRRVKFKTILKYHKWYLCHISL